ncbi:sigma-E factor negative regulatory protein [Massilia forsythiae]|uniref:Sigma-E factor negative regulatory protein n=1 Tax=Massilia forsythiae TaxID=2728020 RepID=A0A7Z2VY05_9BURK|nr:sigma-E factor negative regulatory protein [Massilia forsythiae]QJE01502.1 sigma-E factor negative regulatory protein [Massilia forsythiae]
MDTNKKNREHISAFGDGEIGAADLELALAALDLPEGRQAWELYHHIGDVLRAQATPDLSSGFGACLAEKLAAEPLPGKRAAAAASGLAAEQTDIAAAGQR